MLKDCILVFFLSLISQVGFAAEDVNFIGQIRYSLKSPIDVAVSSSGDIFILDDKLATIRVFNSYGEYSFEFAGIKDSHIYPTDRGTLFSLAFSGEAGATYQHFKTTLLKAGWTIIKETEIDLPQFKTRSFNMFLSSDTSCAWISVAPGASPSVVSIGIEKPR